MEYFYVKVQISPDCWFSDRFSSKDRCKEFFAKNPYNWEAITEDEYLALKPKLSNDRLPGMTARY